MPSWQSAETPDERPTTMRRPNERRIAARHSTVENRILLAWRDDAGHGQVAGHLVNISQTSALLVTQRVPASGASAFLRLVTPSESVWLEAQIVSTTLGLRARLTGKGPCVVRIRFPEACPYDVFKLATHG